MSSGRTMASVPRPLSNCVANQSPSSRTRRDFDEHDEDQRQHARLREQHQVGAEHAGDRAAGPDHRHARAGLEEQLQQGSGQAAQGVEQQVAAVAQPILDVVAENPQKQHVAEKMAEAGVHEHGGRDRRPCERRPA